MNDARRNDEAVRVRHERMLIISIAFSATMYSFLAVLAAKRAGAKTGSPRGHVKSFSSQAATLAGAFLQDSPEFIVTTTRHSFRNTTPMNREVETHRRADRHHP